jgi:hypothetical protein
MNSKQIDKAAGATLEAYVQRYEMNRRIGSRAFPSLSADIMSTGRSVYNTDGGSTIATFTSPQAAEAAILACKRAYTARTGLAWYA